MQGNQGIADQRTITNLEELRDAMKQLINCGQDYRCEMCGFTPCTELGYTPGRIEEVACAAITEIMRLQEKVELLDEAIVILVEKIERR